MSCHRVSCRVVMARSIASLYIIDDRTEQDHVVERGYDPAYGARPLRRAITNLLEDGARRAAANFPR